MDASFQIALIHSIPDAILILERDGRFSNAREKKDGGDVSRYFYGDHARKFSSFLNPVLAAAFDAVLASVLDSGRQESFHFRLQSKEGSLDLEARISRMNPDQALMLLRDVTPEKKIEKAVAHMERLAAVGSMAAAMAHEIRNPLSVIYTISQIMELGELASEKQASSGLRISGQCQRIESIIQDALGYARQSESPELKIEARELLKRSLGLAQLQFGPASRRVEVLIEAPEEELQVYVRASQMEQVLINLILNAYQAMDQGGKIVLRARDEDGKVRMEIQDNGPGVPEDKLASIFEPFYTTKPTGSGLGLSISRRLVREHHGELWAESGQAGGVCFVIRLPRAGQP